MTTLTRTLSLGFLACSAMAAVVPAAVGQVGQAGLVPIVNSGANTLQFDWPLLRIGTAEYAEGPTGATVFHFERPVLAAVDVRGGSPGTVNTDALRLGYDRPGLDAVVFSGGSSNGLETITAVATGLQDDGVSDLALSAGAIIFDLGDRRLNGIYPDKPLAQAALRAARPGVFPLGAHGAGRFAGSGVLYGCNAYSGQGGAFREVNGVKVAVFAVVNSLGVVTGRDGRVAACYADSDWPAELRTNELLASRKADWSGSAQTGGVTRNTTLSLVVTNQALKPAELQRLAVQVHTSMGRALQPFSTLFDGDTLYAVSTAEIGAKEDETEAGLSLSELGILASELMWDAVLSSVPPQPTRPTPRPELAPSAAELTGYAGEYVFSPQVSVRVTSRGGRLFAQAVGKRDAYAIGRDAPVELLPVAASEFTVPGRYPLLLRFEDAGRLVVNPGHWQQLGMRQ